MKSQSQSLAILFAYFDNNEEALRLTLETGIKCVIRLRNPSQVLALAEQLELNRLRDMFTNFDPYSRESRAIISERIRKYFLSVEAKITDVNSKEKKILAADIVCAKIRHSIVTVEKASFTPEQDLMRDETGELCQVEEEEKEFFRLVESAGELKQDLLTKELEEIEFDL